MSSYNFLKAVGDGLAEAINYRTNLKRRRRENEYDYQRDLQRQRDEEAYNRQRDLQWDQENYDIKQNRAKKKKREDIQEAYDFLNNKYFGKELNTPQQIQDFNFEAIASQQPFSVALPKKDTFAQQIALEDYKQKNRIALQQAKNAAKGGGQPKDDRTTMQKNYDWIKSLPPKEREELEEYGLIKPPSAKGGKDNFDPFDKTNYYKNIINGLYKEASQIMPPQEVELVKQMIELENTPEEKLSKENRKKMKESLDKAFDQSKEESKARMNYLLNQARAWLQQGNNHIQYRTNGKYGMHINSGNTINLEAERKAENDVAKNYADTVNSGSNQLLGRAKGMAQSGQNIYPNQPSTPTILYHDNDTPQSLLDASVTEQMPESVAPVFEIPADFDDREDITNDLPLDIAMFENNKNYYEMQYRQGRIGQKKYRQIMSWLDGMKKAYDRGEISEEEFIRNLDPFISNQRS